MTITKQQFFPAGTVLANRFEIVKCLGAGGFGAVYEAKQLVFNQPLRRVALKLFHADRVKPENVREIFSDAVELIGLYEHEPTADVIQSIIQVYDLGIIETTQGPQAYLCMKLVPSGRTLAQPIRRFKSGGGMPVRLTINYLRQLLVPLAWMHTEGERVHGDLKPDNILLNDRDEIVLTDFGLTAHVVFGVFGGTPQYQAPESLLHLQGQLVSKANVAADVYSVGLIWYEMLTGFNPFAEVGLEVTAVGGDKNQVMAAHQESRKWPFRLDNSNNTTDIRNRILPPSAINHEMRDHPQLETLLQSCLAYRQSERPGNAKILLRRLDEYLNTGKIIGLAPPTAACTTPDQPTLPGKSPEALLGDANAMITANRACEALMLVDQLLIQTSPKNRALQIKAKLTKALALATNQNSQEALQICSEVQRLAETEDPLIQAMVQDTKAHIYDAMPNKSAQATNAHNKAAELRRSKGRH